MNSNVPAGAALLLDYLGKAETGIAGSAGYGVVVFHKESKLPKPLTEYTIDELLIAQKTWAKNWKGSAAGRYQIIRATLLGLVKELQIPGSAKFGPDLQDRLGMALLNRRGWQAFTSGQITRNAFALQLAQEWASMPVLSTLQGRHRTVSRGESYYAGDGVNKSQTKADELEALLNRAKAPEAVKPSPADRRVAEEHEILLRPAGTPIPKLDPSAETDRSRGGLFAGLVLIAGGAIIWLWNGIVAVTGMVSPWW